MKVNFTFRKMPTIDKLIEYGEEKIRKLEKYELKVSWAEIVICQQRHNKNIELSVVGKDLRVMAKARSDDLYDALDRVINKVGKQMAKKKQILQKHKHAKRTKEYALEHYTDSFLNVNYHKRGG